LAKKQKPPTWRIGDRVWYAPSLLSRMFRAVVASEPWRLGGYTWVVRLEGLPQEYSDYCQRQRSTVPAAECVQHVTKRSASDSRVSVSWDEGHAKGAL